MANHSWRVLRGGNTWEFPPNTHLARQKNSWVAFVKQSIGI